MDCTPMDEDKTSLPVKLGSNKTKRNNFDRRLISHVRRYPFLYDSRHKFFSDAGMEGVTWQGIANKLKSNADTCKSRWIELLSKYQYYVYRLRNHFTTNQKENCGGQLSMTLDSELICLFKFMDDPKYFPIPNDIVEAVHKEEQQRSTNLDDDLILMEQPVELIVINEDEDDTSMNSEKEFKVTKEMRTLVEHVIKYPELYDCALSVYNDHARRSFLWNVIATEIGDKATKLMKCWIVMVTRYEWEISRTPPKNSRATHPTELQKLMMRFEPYILANLNTVYKQSFYLKERWHEPIHQLKEVLNLIYRMKKLPHVVYITDSLLKNPKKNKHFFSIWAEVAKMKGSTAAECEITWLTMRLFYWELVKMRQHNYQLADRWYFETFISELYELSNKSKMVQQQHRGKPHRQQGAKLHKKGVHCPKKTLSNATENTNVVTAKTIQTQSSNVASVFSDGPPPLIRIRPQRKQAPLPKITSAISLAPKILTPPVAVKGALVIRPIGPHNNKEISPASSLQPAVEGVQPPLVMPKLTKISTLIKPCIASPPPLVISNARSVRCPTVSAPNITHVSPTTANTTNVPGITPKPVICIKVPANASTTSVKAASSSSSVTPVATTSPPVDLPKISGVVSLNNLNEISIELKPSLKGNCLLIEHPALSEKYHLPMPTMVKFIREVLSIPRLHAKHHSEPKTLIDGYWEHMGKRFNLPPLICQASWNFLKGCFIHMAAMTELMKPLPTMLPVWTLSYELFELFDQHAVSNGWLVYRTSLPEIVELIATYPILYKDVEQNVNETNTDMEAIVWSYISSKYPNINHISTIWASFKNVFCQYMSDLERGIDNKWHMHWWRVLARLNFLIEAHYSLNEPYYYIVSSKMMAEIERCALIET